MKSYVRSYPARKGASKTLLILLALFLLGTGAVAATGLDYLANRRPILWLPDVDPASIMGRPQYYFSIKGVSRPLGVAVSPSGDRLYVTESGGQRKTKVFDRDGNLLRSLAPPNSSPEDRSPVYVAVNAAGEANVSERLGHTIHRYAADGAYLGAFSPPGDESWSPLGLSFDGEGRLLLTEVSPGRHRVMVFSPDGELLMEAGKEGKGPADFSFPNGVLAAGQDRLIVSDSNNGRLTVLSGDGRALYHFGTSRESGAVGLPRGLAYDPKRDVVYVADAVSHLVNAYRLQPETVEFLFSVGKPGLNGGEFMFPNGLALDAAGRLYVTDRENDRVQVWLTGAR